MIENKDITVLVVDDEAMLRKGLVRSLELEGFKVLSAPGGKAAFEIIKTEPAIDFVLSDIQMPDGTGVELLDQIRAFNKQLPIVLLVSGFSSYSKADVTKKGAIDLIEKPADIDQIIELIKLSVKKIR